MTDRFRVIITDEVFAELDSIFEFVKQDSPQNAQRLIERLIRDMYSLDFMPERCPKTRTRRFSTGTYRKLVSKPYLIFFRVDIAVRAVYIMEIRHGARLQG
jgi:plasmid stabilization system protein ParE